MKATINEGGKTCTTVNPLGERPKTPIHATGWTNSVLVRYNTKRRIEEWEKAESERQTLEIDHECDENVCGIVVGLPMKRRCKIIPGQTVEIEIVNGKARVL